MNNKFGGKGTWVPSPKGITMYTNDDDDDDGASTITHYDASTTFSNGGNGGNGKNGGNGGGNGINIILFFSLKAKKFFT